MSKVTLHLLHPLTPPQIKKKTYPFSDVSVIRPSILVILGMPNLGGVLMGELEKTSSPPSEEVVFGRASVIMFVFERSLVEEFPYQFVGVQGSIGK
jgi:hypothetical protein